MKRRKIRTEEDFNWLVENSVEVREKYKGKWIAVVNKKVVGVGKTASVAYNKAKKISPNEEPILDAVEKDVEVIYALF